jgi:transcriptional regulator with XRE-family HTH domain
VTTIQKWTGRESRALREAERMSIREFAAHLGVSDRAVSKWEAGGENITPRPDSQAMLDTELKKAPEDARARFKLFLGIGSAAAPGQMDSAANSEEYGTPAATPGKDDGYTRWITHPIDGKTMALIDAGSFPSGPNNQPVWLPAFYIDIYPTTNKDYAEFTAQTGHGTPSHWSGGTYPQGLDKHPVVNVTYHDALSYAFWAEKALPSALEWEKSARGPGGNIFPWGSQETPAKCNVRQTGAGSTTPVDRYHSGVSHYDVYDLAGNVWEWCGTETDPGRFVLKGSAFTSPLGMAAGAAMNDASATMLDDDTGFRCVSTVEAVRNLLRTPGGDDRPV